MEIVKTNNRCDICGTGFNWNNKSIRFGQADSQDWDMVYCSMECFKKEKNAEKRWNERNHSLKS